MISFFKQNKYFHCTADEFNRATGNRALLWPIMNAAAKILASTMTEKDHNIFC